MSNTRKHKGQGKFKNTDTPLDKIDKATQLMWERHNSDYGEDKERQLQIKEKIAEKELETEVKRHIEEGTDFDIPEQDEILKQIFGKK